MATYNISTRKKELEDLSTIVETLLKSRVAKR